MANEKLTLQIDTVTTGTQNVQSLTDALNKVVSISAKAGQSGSAFSSFPGAIKSFVQDPLASAETSITRFASGFGAVGIGTGVAIAGLSAFAAASISATRSLADLAVQTQNISIKTGLSIREVGLFSFAAKAAGGDIDLFQTAMRKLSQGLVDGGVEGKKSADALRAMGVASRTTTGELRPMGEIFQDIGERFNKIGSAAQRNAIAVALFGRSGIELVPVLEKLSKNLTIASSLGIGLGPEEQKKLLDYQQRITEVDAAWEVAKRHFKEGISGTFLINLEGKGAQFLDWIAKGQSDLGKNITDPSLGIITPRPFIGPIDPFIGPKAKVKTSDEIAGDSIASAFQNSRLNSTEGLNARIADLEGKNATLNATLQPGSGVGSAAQSKARDEYNANQRIIDSLKVQVKNIDAVKSAYESLGAKLAAAEGLLLGPVAKVYGELDAQKAIGVNQFTSSATSKGLGALDIANLTASGEIKKQIEEQRNYPLTYGGTSAYRYIPESEKGEINTVKEIGASLGQDAYGGSIPDLLNIYKVETDTEESRKALEDSRRRGSNQVKNIGVYNSVRDNLTNKTADESISSFQSKADFSNRLLSSNTSLTDAQKIAAEYQTGLQSANAIYEVEKRRSADLSKDEDRQKASDDAKLKNELALQKVKEDGIEKIAALEAEKVQEFRSTVGGLFDAIASRQPRAVPDFIKSQGLGLARTITENAAQQYVLPALQKLTPSISGPTGGLLKGTPFESDPLHTSAIKLDGSAASLTAAAHALSAAAAGRSVSSGGTVSGPAGGGSISSLGTDAYGNAIPDITSGGDATSAIGGLSANLPTGVTSTGILGKLLGSNFSKGVGSLANGSSLATLFGSGNSPAAEANYLNTGSDTVPLSARVGAGVGVAGAVIGGGLTAYKDFKQGGAGGALSGIGAIAGTAAALDPEPISKAVLAVAAIALPLIGGFFNGPQRRSNSINQEISENQYQAPTALNVTQGSNGGFTDFGVRGNIRTSDLSPYPQTTNPYLWEQTHGLFGGPPTYYGVPGAQTSQFGGGATPAPTVQHIYQAGAISTIDSTGFQALATRNGPALGNIVAAQMQNGHGRLTAEVQKAANL